MTIMDNLQCTKFCLEPHPLDQSPPRTPDHVRKWRKSNFLDPEMKVIHPSMIGDFQERAYSGQRIVFGCKNKLCEWEDDHVEDLWAQQDCDDYHDVKKGVFEATYKSTPVGRSQSRGHKLPDFMLARNYRHGVTTSKSADGAKQLIYANSAFYNENDSKLDAESSYVVSHGSYKPGQQRRRNYNWPVDPESTTFGIKGEAGKGFGVAQALQMEHEKNDDRSSLGGYERNRDVCDSTIIHSEAIFGISTSHGSSTAAECLGLDDQSSSSDICGGGIVEDVDDLGKSLTPGFRNTSTEHRCFGCPSIRTDIPKYARNSVADKQNYGDDVTAGYLLRPSIFSSSGLEEDELKKPRSKEFLHRLFENCGVKIDFDHCEKLYKNNLDGNASASIESFQNLLEIETDMSVTDNIRS